MCQRRHFFHGSPPRHFRQGVLTLLITASRQRATPLAASESGGLQAIDRSYLSGFRISFQKRRTPAPFQYAQIRAIVNLFTPLARILCPKPRPCGRLKPRRTGKMPRNPIPGAAPRITQTAARAIPPPASAAAHGPHGPSAPRRCTGCGMRRWRTRAPSSPAHAGGRPGGEPARPAAPPG